MYQRMLADIDILNKFQSTLVSPHEKGIILIDVRLISDEICEVHMTMTLYPSAHYKIFSQNPFKRAVIKIIDGCENDLDDKGSDSVQIRNLDFIKSNESGPISKKSYFWEMQLKRFQPSKTKTSYMKVNFNLTIPCAVERFFSLARCVLTVFRKRMSSILFEIILLLKNDRRLWDFKSVAAGM